MGGGVSSEAYSTKDELADAVKRKLTRELRRASSFDVDAGLPTPPAADDGDASPLDRAIRLIAFVEGQAKIDGNAASSATIDLIKLILMEQLLESSAFSPAKAMVSGMLKGENDENVATLVKALATAPSVSPDGRKRSVLFQRSPTLSPAGGAKRKSLSGDGQGNSGDDQSTYSKHIEDTVLEGQQDGIQSIFHWDYDVHLLNQASKGQPVRFGVFSAMHGLGLLGHGGGDMGAGGLLPVDNETLLNYIRTIESGYPAKNPYHNALHAADVVQATGHFLSQGRCDLRLKPWEEFGLLLAAMVHDVEHPGLNNSFLVKTSDSLAVAYNDGSPLENHHISTAFMVMFDRPRHNVLERFPKDALKKVRALMIRCVLATDMAVSFNEVGKMKNLLAAVNAAGQEGGIAALLTDQKHIEQVMVMVLKLSDVSHTARAFDTHYKWSVRCVSEFYNQGDLEKERGMPVLGFMDREVDYLPKSQIGFTKFVVVPMFKTLEQVYPTVVPSLLENISNNIQRWEWYKDGCGDSAEKMKDQQAALVNDEVLQSLDAPAYEGGKVYAPPRV
jgi:hypothetical protein